VNKLFRPRFASCSASALLSKALLCAAFALCAFPAAHADTVIYTVTAMGSGRVGTESFTDQLITVTGQSETNTVIDNGGGNFNNPGLVSFTITEAGGGMFSGVLLGDGLAYSFTSACPCEAGLGAGGVVLLGAESNAFSQYALSTAIGPVTGDAVYSSLIGFQTTAGILQLTSVGQATFTATLPDTITPPPTTATPEPASLLMTGTGLLSIAGSLRRRFVRR